MERIEKVLSKERKYKERDEMVFNIVYHWRKLYLEEQS